MHNKIDPAFTTFLTRTNKAGEVGRVRLVASGVLDTTKGTGLVGPGLLPVVNSTH